MYGWNAYPSTIANISQILGFDGFDTWDKVKYLGLPLTLGQNNPSNWLENISKLKEMIALWGGHCLTMTGKLVLIKSTLSALQIYQSSLLLAPKAIMDQISKLIRDFLWRGGKGKQNRMHSVKWDIVKRPVLEGGLQIRDPGLANLAMGSKLLWQHFSNKKHPVSQIFWKKYLNGGTLRNLQVTNIPMQKRIRLLCLASLSHTWKWYENIVVG